jgi:adenine-specific DNA glycosylase
MKNRCCRSTPRCASCPVRAAVTARKQRSGDEAAALLSEIFAAPPDAHASAERRERARQLDLARTR